MSKLIARLVSAAFLLVMALGVVSYPQVAAARAQRQQTVSAVGNVGKVAGDDLTGTWLRDYVASNFTPLTDNKSTDSVFTLHDGSVIPLRPEAEKIYRERVAMGETTSVFANTTARCLPLGTPQNMMGAPPYPIRIVQTPGVIVMLMEEGWEFRAINMHGKHPEESIPSFMGYSIGHWEGKTLVVETVGLRADTTLNFTGLPHSEQMRVIERLSRPERDTLIDLIEIDDPVMYFKPFVFKSVFHRTQQEQMEYICEDAKIKVTSEGRQTY